MRHQAVVDKVVKCGDRERGAHFGAHVVDDEQVGALIPRRALRRRRAVAVAELDGLVGGDDVDGGVVGDRKAARRDCLRHAGGEKGLAESGRAVQQQIG